MNPESILLLQGRLRDSQPQYIAGSFTNYQWLNTIEARTDEEVRVEVVSEPSPKQLEGTHGRSCIKQVSDSNS
jgi:hypothetical protein